MTRSRTSSDVELLVALDRRAPEPLHRQLEANLRSGVREGRLGVGHHPALDPRARRPAWRLARASSWRHTSSSWPRDTSRPAGRHDPGRAHGAGGPPLPVARTPSLGVRLPSRPARRHRVPAGGLAALDAPRPGRGARRPPRLPRRAGHPGAADRARRRTSTASAARRSSPGRSSSAAGSPRASGSIAQALAARGARTMAVEDPSDPEYRASIAAAGSSRSAILVDEHGLVVDGPRAARPGCRRRDGGPPVPDRRRAPRRAADRARRLGRAPQRVHRRGRLRRGVPLRPGADRRAPGAPAGPRRSTPGRRARRWRPGCGSAGWPRPRRSSGRSPRRSRPPTWGPRPSTSSPSPTSSSAASSTGSCAGCGRSTAARRDELLAALARHLPDVRPVGASAGPPRARVAAAGHRRGGGRRGRERRRDRACPGCASAGSGRRAPGLVFGYGTIAEARIEPGIARLAAIVRAAR